MIPQEIFDYYSRNYGIALLESEYEDMKNLFVKGSEPEMITYIQETELINRITDLYNYVQAAKNQLDQIDAAIERVKTYAENLPHENCIDVNCPHRTGITS